MIGKEIGNCRILKELGKGGMGVVYKANQLSLGRMVAMKVLPQHLTSDPSFIKRFENEARAIAKLNHPNIVQIYDIGHEDEIYYYTMEFIEGPALDEILYKEGFFQLDRAMGIVLQVARALQYAHSQGIVHRDIKPSNIMIDKSGRVKVTDFGLALQERTTRLTVEGSIVGTPEYMSPEQAAGQVATARSDIYSLGVVFYELLTGKVPFEAESPLMVLNRIQTSEPEWPRSINPDIPVEAEKAIQNMMAKKPRNRYASCQELIQDLRRLKTGQPISTQARRKKGLRLLAAGAGLLIVGIVIALKMTNGNGPSPPPPPNEWEEALAQVDQDVAALDGRLKELGQRCEGGDAAAANDELDRTEQLLASLDGRLEGIRQAAGPALAKASIDKTDAQLELLGEQLTRVRQECTPAEEPPPIKDLFGEMNVELGTLGELFSRIRHQCEQEDVAALEGGLAEAEAKVAALRERLKNIGTPLEGEDMPALKDALDQLKRRAALPDDYVKGLQEYMWPDRLVLNNGNTIWCEIVGEWLEKVRIRKARAQSETQADISRSEIKLTVYATDVQKQIAKTLRSEMQKIEQGIREFRGELAEYDIGPEPEPVPEKVALSVEGETGQSIGEEKPPEERGSSEKKSIQVPMLEETWHILSNCSEESKVTFEDDTISMFVGHPIQEPLCSITAWTKSPIERAPASIELLVEVKRLILPQDGRVVSSFVLTFSDGKRLEYPIFDSQSDLATGVQEAPNTLRISRPQLFVLLNKGWHTLVLPIAEDAAKLEGEHTLETISLVQSQMGQTAGLFVLRCRAIILSTM